ncbi:hypothetical protein N8467_01330, partial [bacterium]|nr:hypothetical protein [bacterium]
SGSLIAASSRRAPPQFGHVKISTPNTHSTQLRPRVVAPNCGFIRPRCLRSREVLVELVLLAILIDPRNDPVPQAGTRRQHTVIRHQVLSRSRHQGQQPLNQHLRLHHYMRRGSIWIVAATQEFGEGHVCMASA